ncbi:hypothetical protein SAMN04487911_10349 [Arenibacter nanhaiticus]|uniref:Uncharacterized protein n=1 Tax=Arenibacter nanhaiticus TaxID=558155 RepID=A0A1M6C253_9FLAO|nr:hypothetical protein [Arenibacter nanhaiticus]SHI54834.1 hypothetical protein SAMN04487911_10349 [Arenibacter nanhaiticus]
MTKLFWIFLSTICMTAYGNFQDNKFLENDFFKLTLDNQGNLTELLEKETGKNLLMKGYNASLLTIQSDGVNYPITSWERAGEILKLKFNKIGAEISVNINSENSYLTFEIVKVKSVKFIEKVIWGPYHVLPSEKIGQSIGIAYDDNTAIGLMGLNLKSRGGFEIETRERFGNAAKRIDGGASLTGFVRDRSRFRTVDNWEQKLGQSVPVKDSDAEIIGAKFAFYCVPTEKLLKVVEEIVLNEDLPYIKTKNVWNKVSQYSSSSKLIMSYNVNNIEACIDVAEKAGITSVYHGGIFKTWGTFMLDDKDFPKGYQSVRECSDIAEKHGINLGAHTLTNFITTNDPLVTPRPDPGLVMAGITRLEKSISENDDELLLQDEVVRPAYHEPNIEKVNPRWREHTAVRIGDEIIEYSYATSEGKLVLKDCKRGAFGTKAVKHKKGEKVSRLMSHGYKVFFPDINLQDQMAKNLAKFFNEANLKRISFDGIEGGLASGHGRYGSDRFVKVFFDHLKDPNIVANSSDVTHFGWHYFANESWGEPWTSDNFREAHLSHRLDVQQALKEDLLPRKMGQFSINANTTKKDIEWVMGLCAGYDAGVDFYISPNFEEINKEANSILSEIKKWENARMEGLFTEAQKEKLRDPYTFYGLERNGEGVSLVFIESWAPEGGRTQGENDFNSLSSSILKSSPEAPVSLDYRHTNMTTEPGQPTAAIWKYFCAGPKQKLQFVIRLPKESRESVNGIYLKVGAKKIVMPFTLAPGDFITNKGNSTYKHLSADLQVKNEVIIDEGYFTVNEGQNVIEFDYQGKGRDAGPEMIVNFRTIK